MMDIQHDVFNISFSDFAREIVNSEAASAESLANLARLGRTNEGGFAGARCLFRKSEAFF